MTKFSLQVLSCLVVALCLIAVPAHAANWWMLQQSEEGRQCGPPIEAEGVSLTPEELLKRYPECKLMDETPSLDLEAVMLNCEGDIGQVFVFTKTKAACEHMLE